MKANDIIDSFDLFIKKATDLEDALSQQRDHHAASWAAGELALRARSARIRFTKGDMSIDDAVVYLFQAEHLLDNL